MQEFGFPRKLITLTKMCINDTKYQVRMDQTLSKEFEVITGLKQRDALSPRLFNISLEKIISNVKNNNLGTNIGATQIDILGFADDLNLIGDSVEIVEQNTNILIEGAKSVGLKINQDKTKVMK
jgi:hypothetical protein